MEGGNEREGGGREGGRSGDQIELGGGIGRWVWTGIIRTGDRGVSGGGLRLPALLVCGCVTGSDGYD